MPAKLLCSHALNELDNGTLVPFVTFLKRRSNRCGEGSISLYSSEIRDAAGPAAARSSTNAMEKIPGKSNPPIPSENKSSGLGCVGSINRQPLAGLLFSGVSKHQRLGKDYSARA